MADLLTKAEYEAIAKSLVLPSQAFINGGYRPAESGKTFDSVNPATGAVLTSVASCGPEDIDFAVQKARESFEDGRWSKMHPTARKEVLLRFCELLHQNQRELAVMESLDSGKTIYDCENVDVPETIHCLKWHAELIDKIYDEVAPSSSKHLALVVREPIGVVGLVLPWNFPLLMLAWKIGPALAAGCSLVVKPATETALTALRVAALASEAGVPDGVLNIVPGRGGATGEPLGKHPDVDMVSFTGSTETGRRFLHYSAESNLKEVVLEMGGKNPCIVMDDAGDLDTVAEWVVTGAFWNMGENCSAAARLVVHRGVKDALLEKVAEKVKKWRVGDPLDPDTRVGALVSKAHFDKVCSYLDVAASEKILIGGKSYKGAFVEPTVVEVSGNDSLLAREEIFGPILSVITVSSFEEAIKVGNATEYGLAASLFTMNAKRAIKGAQALRAGTVHVNSFGEGDIATPFGGYKQSGFGGRDNSIHAHDQYTQIKTIWLDLSEGWSDVLE